MPLHIATTGGATPTDPIVVTLTVDESMTDVVTINGAVTLPSGVVETASTTVTRSGSWGPVTASGYTSVEGTGANVNKFTLTP